MAEEGGREERRDGGGERREGGREGVRDGDSGHTADGPISPQCAPPTFRGSFPRARR